MYGSLSTPGNDRPKDFWTPFKGRLAEGFRNLCAYSAMYEPVGTVDHFVSCHEDRSRAYEWGQLPLLCGMDQLEQGQCTVR